MPEPTPADPTLLLEPTYARGDVRALLTAGDVELVTVERKEALLRAGRSYGTLLTPEGAPSALQRQAYEGALQRNGERIGALLAGLSATLLNTYETAVYVSLARAGIPVGCVLRRLAGVVGQDVPHYAVSIIRGEGLDAEALRRIRAAHPGAALVFIDGWSGKGAIADTLRASLPAGLPWALAMLSDPAGVATHAATWDDLLLPHAALNATVSGLLSRTFVQGPGQLHAARLERELEPFDVSRVYVDVLTDLARHAAPTPAADGRARPHAPATVALALAGDLGVRNAHLVKPSVGEATRVFLRRAPSHLMLRDVAQADTRHLLELARQRGVPVSVHRELPYLAAAVIDPGARP